MKATLSVLCVLLCSTLAQAQSSARAGDVLVLNKLHEANQLEISAGKLAQTQTSSPGVKKFGSQLIKDHSAADAELTKLAQKKGVKLDAVDQSKLNEIKDLKGGKFDRAFAVLMVEGHKNAVSLVEAQKGEEHDEDVRAFLEKNLPVLKKHLEHAQQLEDPLPHT